MKVVKSLLPKIINQAEIFNATLDMYNDALSLAINFSEHFLDFFTIEMGESEMKN